MQLMNKRDQYGWPAIALHWLLFLLIAGLTGSGKYSASLEGEDKIFEIIAVHKQVGVAVFALMFFRLLWKLANKRPQKLEESRVLFALAFITHWLLYVAVLAQALGGVLMSQLFGREVFFLGLELPLLLGEGGWITSVAWFGDSMEEAARFLRMWHGYGGDIIGVLVMVHILGVLNAVFIMRTDALRRMWFSYKPPYAKK